jgi:hypothetical protein
MMSTRYVLGAAAVLAAMLAAGAVLAQAPPHTPGTVCYTPTFWCWAQPPGPPGRPCVCRTDRGPVAGRLG